MLRNLRLLRVQLRAALLLAMQYRLDFFVQSAMAIGWTATPLVPLVVLFRLRPEGIAGWSAAEALVVVGFFVALKGVINGAIQPSLSHIVEQIRTGKLDFVLLKPADAQLLLSTSKLDLARSIDVIAGLVLVTIGVTNADVRVGPGDVAATALLLVSALAILYSIWLCAVSLAFYVVKIDNLSHLISTTYDAARWPSSVFRGVLAFVFTFIIPLALMTTYPSLAILGRITALQLVGSLLTATVLAVLSRKIWVRSIGKYTSAGG